MSVPESVIVVTKKALNGDPEDGVSAAVELLEGIGLPEARAVLIVAGLSRGPLGARELMAALIKRGKQDKRVVTIGKSIKERAVCGPPDALLNEAEDLVLAIRMAEAAGYSAEPLKTRAEEINRTLVRRIPSPREHRMAVSFMVSIALVGVERRFGPFATYEEAVEWRKKYLWRDATIEPVFNPVVQLEEPQVLPVGVEDKLDDPAQ